MSKTIGKRLGETFSRSSYDSRSSEAIHEMKRLTLDFLGVTLSGSQTDTGRIAGDFVDELGGQEHSTVIGRNSRVPALHAAFANAISAHSIELDDIDEDAYFHFAPPVVSSALAVGQQVSANGRDLLDSLLVGCEMMLRLSRATNPSLRDHGFHTTPTCGTFGAAAAAARLLGLSEDPFTNALGLAGAQAAGVMEMYGPSMQKRFNPGPAARSGVTAAQLASRGFTGADTIFEGERGFGVAFAGGLDPAPLLEDLGNEMPVPIEYKPYSCARPIHNAIDCALGIRNQLGHETRQISRILVGRHPRWAGYHLNSSPQTYHEAQMSLPFSVAIALIDGRAMPADYSVERLHSEEILRLMSLISVEADSRLARGVSCRMTAMTYDGRELTCVVDHPKGSTRSPMTDKELEEKAAFLAATVIPRRSFDRVVDLIMNLEEVDDVNDLFDLIGSANNRS